jgi:carboxyl-terminal processing protease
MKPRLLTVIIILAVAVLLVGAAFTGGLMVGSTIPIAGLASGLFGNNAPVDPSVSVSGSTPVAGSTPVSREELFKPFWEAWDIVHAQFVDQPVNDTTLMRGAIDGMLASLGDKHTSYMDPQEFTQANMPLSGEYEGIGAWVDTTGEFLTVVSPMKDSPADKAGLKPGDQIIAVDGEDVTKTAPDLVLRKVLGPAGTQVKLSISRPVEGAEPESLEFTITRAKITLASVEYEMLDNNIAYVRLLTYGEKTTDELKNALTEVMKNKPAGLIFDLRDNGGGYLNTAIEVISQFVAPNKIAMYEKFGDGTVKTYYTSGKGLATDIPMVVLVNGGTASASEITAGAFQDFGRAKLVGETTYGKGSVQNWIPLSDNGAVRVTIARWLTPKERLIHEIGITPDYVVPFTEEDAKAGKDPQLDKAIQLLLNPGSIQ